MWSRWGKGKGEFVEEAKRERYKVIETTTKECVETRWRGDRPDTEVAGKKFVRRYRYAIRCDLFFCFGRRIDRWSCICVSSHASIQKDAETRERENHHQRLTSAVVPGAAASLLILLRRELRCHRYPVPGSEQGGSHEWDEFR